MPSVIPTVSLDAKLISLLPERQRPLVQKLIPMLEEVQSLVNSITDNAIDANESLDRGLSDRMARQCRLMASRLEDAWAVPQDWPDYTAPSMSKKELI